MLELYKNIKKFRTEIGMTQTKLAELTGYTDRSSIAKIENGDVDLPQSKIMLIANALGVDAGVLMGDICQDAPAVFLEPDQERLLFFFNQLNAAGRAAALERIEEMTQNKKFTALSSAEKMA